jgi:hypothetical protein
MRSVGGGLVSAISTSSVTYLVFFVRHFALFDCLYSHYNILDISPKSMEEIFDINN